MTITPRLLVTISQTLAALGLPDEVEHSGREIVALDGRLIVVCSDRPKLVRGRTYMWPSYTAWLFARAGDHEGLQFATGDVDAPTNTDYGFCVALVAALAPGRDPEPLLQPIFPTPRSRFDHRAFGV